MNTQIDQAGIDSCVSIINDALTTSAKKIFHSTTFDRQTQKKKFKKKESKAWYTKECKSQRNVLRYRSKELGKDPFNRSKVMILLRQGPCTKKHAERQEMHTVNL